MNQTTKITASIGVIYGLYFSMKGNKGFVETALFVLLFGAAGIAAGGGSWDGGSLQIGIFPTSITLQPTRWCRTVKTVRSDRL